MKKTGRKAFVLILVLTLLLMMTSFAFADGGEESVISGKALAAGIAIGLPALGGAIAMGIATGKASEGIARQPEVKSDVRTNNMLGLVFIETTVIYALLTVILIIFVL